MSMFTTRVALTTLTLLSSVLSFGAYTLLLKYLGNTASVDRLFFAGSVPMSISGVVTGVLLYVLPPRLARLDSDTQEATLRVLALAVIGVCVLCALPASTGVLLTPADSFWLLWFGFSNIAGMLVLANLATCVAQVRGEYLVTGIAPLVTSIGLLAGTAAGVAYGLEWLLVVGQWLGAFAAICWSVRVLGLPTRGRLREDWQRCVDALAPLRPHAAMIALGTIAFTLFQPIDAALCTQLESGSLSIMSYAQRVLVAVCTVVSLGAHAIAARTSHDALLAGGSVALRRLANRECMRIVVVGVLVCAAYQAGGDRLLMALFSTSKMAAADQYQLQECLRWMLIAVGPMAAMPYLFRVFYSAGVYWVPAVLGSATALGYAALAWLLLSPFGLLAMAYAYALIWWVTMIAAVLWLNSPVMAKAGMNPKA
jgi:peptidoglycan biosynthesis protein MviN/MurJ (putative lipid II flippase)